VFPKGMFRGMYVLWQQQWIFDTLSAKATRADTLGLHFIQFKKDLAVKMIQIHGISYLMTCNEKVPTNRDFGSMSILSTFW